LTSLINLSLTFLSPSILNIPQGSPFLSKFCFLKPSQLSRFRIISIHMIPIQNFLLSLRTSFPNLSGQLQLERSQVSPFTKSRTEFLIISFSFTYDVTLFWGEISPSTQLPSSYLIITLLTPSRILHSPHIVHFHCNIYLLVLSYRTFAITEMPNIVTTGNY
jgi:hypothetical protein